MPELTHLSLFSGIGGLDIAAEIAGFRTVGQCEWADYQTSVLEKNFPHVPRWRDIRTLTKESFYEKTGLRTVTVVSGGFPCQPFSVAGKRRGTEDDRFLWPEMLRVISELRPDWVLGENVAGLASMGEPGAAPQLVSKQIACDSDSDVFEAVYAQQEIMLLNRICEEFESIGYEVQPFLIPACAVGANHQRERLFIVARHTHIINDGTVEGVCGWAGSISAGVCKDVPDTQGDGLEKRRMAQRRQVNITPGVCNDMADSAGRENNKRIVGIMGEAPSRWQGVNASAYASSSDVADPEMQPQRSGFRTEEPGWIRRGRSGDCSCTTDVSDAGSIRGQEWISESAQREERNPREPIDCDNRSGRWPGGGGWPAQSRLGGLADGFPAFLDRSWWRNEPDIPRVATGVKNRVEQLKCYGNAVVPAQVYPILKAIADVENGLV